MTQYLPDGLLDPQGILPDLRVNSKKQVLRAMARLASQTTGLDERLIYQALSDREKLGSTGFGDGVALPHAKLARLSRTSGVFARLHQPVSFDAVDGLPVDLVFGLLAPDQEGESHLTALAGASRLFRDQDMRRRLRGASDRASLLAILTVDGS